MISGIICVCIVLNFGIDIWKLDSNFSRNVLKGLLVWLILLISRMCGVLGWCGLGSSVCSSGCLRRNLLW